MCSVSAHPYVYFVAEKRILCLEERKSLFAETVARGSSLRIWSGRPLLCPLLSRAPSAPENQTRRTDSLAGGREV